MWRKLKSWLAPRRPVEHPIRATYDAAASPDELKNYWGHTDAYDADSAHSRAVRETLVQRSRYEVGNNGYADGIAQTYATDVVGTGPTLRMRTSSTPFNRMVEQAWAEWSEHVGLRRKLWAMAHAKHMDGEAFAVLSDNPRLARDYPLSLDVRLYETEQIQTPNLPVLYQDTRDGYIDGIKFDRYGNIEWYDLLRYHPGESRSFRNLEPLRVSPEMVLHWFKMRRPGQHRGVPEQTSTLNVGAAARRWRAAVLAAAETAADFSVLMKTAFPPDELDDVGGFTSLDIQKRMLTALPMGWDATQMRAEQPTATHAEFSKSLIAEQSRPKSMPYNKAACDSSDYNFASGRLDHITYYAALDVDRADATELVLVPAFLEWFREAQVAFGWLDGDLTALPRMRQLATFDWPRHSIADEKSEAQANDTRLRNGSLSLSRYYAQQGIDYDDELESMADGFGISADEMKTVLLHTYFPAAASALGGAEETPEGDLSVVTDDDEEEEGPDEQTDEQSEDAA